MAGKEWERLLERLPDLAALHRGQTLRHMIKVAVLGVGAAAAVTVATVVLVKSYNRVPPAQQSAPPPEVPAVVHNDTPPPPTTTAVDPYTAPNPEIRQENPTRRHSIQQ